MDEYIRREDAIKCIEDQCTDGKMWGNDESEMTLIDAYSAIDDLMEIPPADVSPVLHGRWIKHDDGVLTCSECGNAESIESYFCGYCGTKMDGDDDDECSGKIGEVDY